MQLMSNISVQSQALSSWWQSPLGQAFILDQRRMIDPILSRAFGYHFLLIGDRDLMALAAQSPILHQVCIDPQSTTEVQSSTLASSLRAQESVRSGQPLKQTEAMTAQIDAAAGHKHTFLHTRADTLPIASDSVDVVVLAHCLSGARNPHEVLREAYRILRPEGQLIMTGFNLWSLWGLYAMLVGLAKRLPVPAGLFKGLPWVNRFISMTRLQDWLALLGFECLESHWHFFRPPINNPALLERLSVLEKIGAYCYPLWGAGLILSAKKPVLTLTPIRPRFQEVLQRDSIIVPECSASTVK